jgi:hypothetical protein
LSALIIALNGKYERFTSPSNTNRNVQYFVSKILRENFITQSKLGNVPLPEKTITVKHEKW